MLVKDVMHPRTVTVEPHVTLPEAVVKMQELKVKRLPVTMDGKLVGLLTDGEIKRHLPTLKEGLTPWEFAGRAGRVRVREAMRTPVYTASPNETIEHVIQTLLDRRVGGMPVVDDEGVMVGMLTLTDVLRAELREPKPEWGSAEQHMTGEVVAVTPDEPLSNAEAKLHGTRLRVLPVVLEGKLVGLLHQVDLYSSLEREMAATGQSGENAVSLLDDNKVSEIMRSPMGYLRQGAPLQEALEKMVNLDVHGLPVIDESGRLLGVLTVSDVLKAIVPQPKDG